MAADNLADNNDWSLSRMRVYHLAFAASIPYNAYRKGSLNPPGAVLAGLFAIITLVLSPTLVFATSLLAFFFAGSKATKYKAGVKAGLEEQHGLDASTTTTAAATKAANSTTTKTIPKDVSSGNRDAWQVACNGVVGSLCCIAWMWRFGISFSYAPGEALPCPVSENAGGNLDMKISNALIFTAIGFWSSCMGDTLASELGMLATTQPRLITSFKTVPAGTNGGITAWGTLVSAAGGAFIASIALLTLVLEENTCAWQVSDPASLKMGGTIVGMGVFAGLFGSLLDSILGATLQETLYDQTSRKVVHSRISKDSKAKIVASGSRVLSNNGVNAISGAVTSAICGWIGWNLSL